MAESIEPGVLPQQPVDYEALAIVEAQQPLVDAAQVLREYGIEIDEDKTAVVLSILAGDARRRYRANPEAYTASARSVGAVGVSTEVDPDPSASASEAQEAAPDPAIDFASKIAISYTYLGAESLPSGANDRYQGLEPKKGGKSAMIEPRIPVDEMAAELAVRRGQRDGGLHETVRAAYAVNSRGRTVAYEVAFPSEAAEEEPKGSRKERREAKRAAKEIEDDDREEAEDAPERGDVSEVAYVIGDSQGVLANVSMFMDENEVDELRDMLDTDPRFLRRVLGAAMSSSDRRSVRAAWRDLEAQFADWDQTDAALAFWDQSTPNERREILNVPAA